MRAFVGIPLPDTVTAALSDLQAGLRVGRPVASENLHLTLAFLDDQPETALAALHDELSAITGPAPRISFAGLDVFGGSRPKILFALVAADKALKDLRSRVRKAAREAGIELPRERFRPHVTLARFRGRAEPDETVALHRFLTDAGGASLPGFTADRFALFRSTLTPDGAIYDELADYPLIAGTGLVRGNSAK